jgi:hypothetical protein
VTENGIVQLVQGNAAVAALCTSGGGFLAELPKGQPLPSWTYQTISNVPEGRALASIGGLRRWHVQIDCFGYAASDVISLSEAVIQSLNGFKGALSDTDKTSVDSAFWIDSHDPEFDSVSRTWRRVIEFEVFYTSQF